MFVQTAVGFAIGAASTGSGATGDAGARVRSRPGETRARGDSERAIPVPARRLSPRSRRARRKNPRARVEKDTCATFSFRGHRRPRTRGGSRQCTHRLVAHLQGLELIGGFDHLDHLERESVGVCVARGVGMKAGATQTLFFFREVRRVVNQRRRFRKLRRVTSHDSARVAESPAPLSLNVLVRPNPPRPITLNARGPDQVLVFEMSQYVARATGMATKALDVAKTRVLPPAVEWYNATMAKNAQYVVKDPEAVDKLGKQLIYSNMAKLPAAVEAAQGEIKVVQQKWTNRMDLPMTEVRSPGAMSSVIPRTVFACPARVFLARGVGSIEGRPKIAPTTHLFPLCSPQVGTAALFSAEVYAWFCVGEIIGRGGSLTGY